MRGVMARPKLVDERAQAARANFFGWLRWYWYEHRADLRSQADLARAIGITPATLSYLLTDEGRYPSFPTLLAIRHTTGFSLDTLTQVKPPPVPDSWAGARW